MKRRWMLMLVVISGLAAIPTAQLRKPFDLVLRGSVVMDGSGAPVIRNGALTGEKPGRVLARARKQ